MLQEVVVELEVSRSDLQLDFLPLPSASVTRSHIVRPVDCRLRKINVSIQVRSVKKKSKERGLKIDA